ncbi:MAG: hypothetical protein GY934_22125, partial [Gammaproteobacteria bacterium]|nr:hypothetical protein [Gammaproteobacteria bacterium]
MRPMFAALAAEKKGKKTRPKIKRLSMKEQIAWLQKGNESLAAAYNQLKNSFSSQKKELSHQVSQKEQLEAERIQLNTHILHLEHEVQSTLSAHNALPQELNHAGTQYKNAIQKDELRILQLEEKVLDLTTQLTAANAAPISPGTAALASAAVTLPLLAPPATSTSEMAQKATAAPIVLMEEEPGTAHEAAGAQHVPSAPWVDQPIHVAPRLPVQRQLVPEDPRVQARRQTVREAPAETIRSAESQSVGSRRKQFNNVIKKMTDVRRQSYALSIQLTAGIQLAIYTIALVVTRLFSRKDEREWMEFLVSLTTFNTVSDTAGLQDNEDPLIPDSSAGAYGASEESVSSKLTPDCDPTG